MWVSLRCSVGMMGSTGVMVIFDVGWFSVVASDMVSSFVWMSLDVTPIASANFRRDESRFFTTV